MDKYDLQAEVRALPSPSLTSHFAYVKLMFVLETSAKVHGRSQTTEVLVWHVREVDGRLLP